MKTRSMKITAVFLKLGQTRVIISPMSPKITAKREKRARERERAIGRERYTATLSSMGLRAEASLAKHLLLENCWENNLLSDISKVDYLEGHQGRTNLQPLDGLPLFVDHIYACGYLDRTEVVGIHGKVSCEPVSKQIVARISMAAQEVLGGPRKKHKNLEHSACKLQRLQNHGNDCENRERPRAAGKKAVEKALPGEGGVRVFCSENRCVGGRDHPSAEAPTNTGQTSGKPRRQHVRNRLYPGLLRNGRQKRPGIPSAGKRWVFRRLQSVGAREPSCPLPGRSPFLS